MSYITEEEQIENIKKWWNRYSGLITVIFSVILLTIAGYRYWNWHDAKIKQQASNTYERLMYAVSNQDNKSVRSYANLLITEYSNTVYADIARFSLAKILVSHEKYQQAEAQLQWVVDHSKQDALQQVAVIRLARLLLAEKSYDKALTTLDKVEDASYLPVINELKGDIYAATGRYPQAMASYKQAMEEVQTKGIGNLFLEMKSNEMATLTQSLNQSENKLAKA